MGRMYVGAFRDVQQDCIQDATAVELMALGKSENRRQCVCGVRRRGCTHTHTHPLDLS